MRSITALCRLALGTLGTRAELGPSHFEQCLDEYAHALDVLRWCPAASSLLETELVELHVMRGVHSDLRQAGPRAGERTAVDGYDGATGAGELHQRLDAPTDTGDTRHLSPSRMVQSERDIVGQLRHVRAARTGIYQGKGTLTTLRETGFRSHVCVPLHIVRDFVLAYTATFGVARPQRHVASGSTQRHSQSSYRARRSDAELSSTSVFIRVVDCASLCGTPGASQHAQQGDVDLVVVRIERARSPQGG